VVAVTVAKALMVKLETVNDWVSAAELLLKPSIKLVPVGRTTGEHSTDNSPQDQTSSVRRRRRGALVASNPPGQKDLLSPS